MRKKRLCLVENRYTAINYPDRIRIIEITHASDSRHIRQLHDIQVAEAQSDDRACLMTLVWLRDNGFISASDYLEHAQKFLTQASMGKLELLKPDAENGSQTDESALIENRLQPNNHFTRGDHR